MTFQESIATCLTKYADFEGRASRAEFWWFAVFVTLATAALTQLDIAWAGVFQVAMLLPLLAAGSRRLYDIGRSGWWLLFAVAPVGGIVLLMILWARPPLESAPAVP